MSTIKLGNLLWRPHTRPISPEDPVDVKDVNTADIKAKLETVQSELALVKAELQEIKANQLSGDQKVQLSGTIAGVTPHYNLKTVANAVSIPAGTHLDFSLGLTGDERYVYILINTSQQPWSILGYNELGGRALACLYPEYNNFTATFPNIAVPARALYCPVRYRVLSAEGSEQAIVTIAERSYKGLATSGNDKVRFVNESNEINTVTIRVQTY